MALPFAPPAAPTNASEPAPASASTPTPASDTAVVAAAEAARSSTSPVASVPTPDAAFARPAAPVVTDAPPSGTTGSESTAQRRAARAPAPPENRSGIGILLLAAAGLAIGVLGYRYTHRDRALADLAALPIPPAVPTPPASPSALSAEPAPAQEPAASASAADFPAAAPAPLDSSAAAAPAASAAVADNQPAAAAQRVTINTLPPKAKFFHFGKEVGTAPFVVDLPPGEKRAYEVWLPGHITRKLVIDGSKQDITLGLREEPH
jgi:hypothetical protein